MFGSKTRTVAVVLAAAARRGPDDGSRHGRKNIATSSTPAIGKVGAFQLRLAYQPSSSVSHDRPSRSIRLKSACRG